MSRKYSTSRPYFDAHYEKVRRRHSTLMKRSYPVRFIRILLFMYGIMNFSYDEFCSLKSIFLGIRLWFDFGTQLLTYSHLVIKYSWQFTIMALRGHEWKSNVTFNKRRNKRTEDRRLTRLAHRKCNMKWPMSRKSMRAIFYLLLIWIMGKFLEIRGFLLTRWEL